MQIGDIMSIIQTCIAAASLIVSIVTLEKVTKINLSNRENNKTINKTSNKQVAKGKGIIQGWKNNDN